MGESLLLITIITLIVLTIRRGRPVVLENPVIIQRPGQYHIVLAPQLNRVQAFVEQIAKQFSQSYSVQGDVPSRYFEVRDPKVFARGADCYLLAATSRGGMLYFQAANPKPSERSSEAHLATLREFSESVLKLHPHTGQVDQQGAQKLDAAVEEVAGQLKIVVKTL